MLEKSTIYSIPYKDKYIIYCPLKPLAFIGNAAMVNFIADLKNKTTLDKNNNTIKFLQNIGFFDDDKVLEINKPDNKFQPVNCILLLTNACNLHCIYCYAFGGENENKVLDFETGTIAIDFACKNAISRGKSFFMLGFHGGGEPTMAPKRMNDFINYALSKELPCKISLTTNGYMSDKSRKELITKKLSEVSLSFDGIPFVQNSQRPDFKGRETFSSVMKTVEFIEKLKISYGIRMSVSDFSIKHLEQSIDFISKNTSCKVIQVEPVFNHGRALEKGTYLKKYKAFTNAFIKAYEIAEANKIKMYYSGARPWIITNKFCLAPEEAIIVTPYGDLTACYEVFDTSHHLSESFMYGQINESNVLINNNLRHSLLSKIEDRKTHCKNCFCYYNCAGDCPPKNFTSGEDGHLNFNKRCDVNRELTKELLLSYIEKAGGVWKGYKFKKNE